MKYQKKIEVNNGRREFLILSSTLPLLLVPIPSKAIIPGLIFRFFARKILDYIVKPVIRFFFKPSIKKGGNRLNIQKVFKINNQINDVVDVSGYLSDQVWDSNKENYSTLVISNPTNKTLNTQDISLNMYDTDKQNIDFKTQLASIDVPAKSSVIVELLFKNIDTSGMKRIYGEYKNDIYTSGNILVDKNIDNGLSIEELYRRKNRKYDGGMDKKLYLNPNIILS